MKRDYVKPSLSGGLVPSTLSFGRWEKIDEGKADRNEQNYALDVRNHTKGYGEEDE